MKKLIATFVLLGAFIFAVNAQTTPPKAVTDAFAKKYAKVTDVKWTQDATSKAWVATFNYPVKTGTASYDETGKLIVKKADNKKDVKKDDTKKDVKKDDTKKDVKKDDTKKDVKKDDTKKTN
jgi:hypothetical protein